MSIQIRYAITFGSGEHGIAVENKLRAAAAVENVKFSEWVINTLKARAETLLSGPAAHKKSA